MSDKATTTLIIAIVIVAVLIVFILRAKNLKSIRLKFMGTQIEGETHKPDQLVVKDVVQVAQSGCNEVAIRSINATVDGIHQTAKKDNKLEIGNP